MKFIDKSIIGARINGIEIIEGKLNGEYVFGHVEEIDYIKDGMMLWWDGHANYQQCHINNAPYWEDLSGQENHGFLWGTKTTMSWVDSGIKINESAESSAYVQTDYQRTGKLISIPSQITMECCVENLIAQNSWSALIHTFGLNDISGYWFGFTNVEGSVDKPTIKFFFATTYGNSFSVPTTKRYKTYTVTYSAPEMRVIIYGDGVQIYNAVSNKNNLGAHESKIKICNSSATNEQLAGTIHSARVYNRILSPAEIQQNHQADLARYFN